MVHQFDDLSIDIAERDAHWLLKDQNLAELEPKWLRNPPMGFTLLSPTGLDTQTHPNGTFLPPPLHQP